MQIRRNAFTLIELLVVIAIIAILAAILFPVFASAKSAAKKTVDLSDIKQLMVGVLFFTNDTDDTTIYLPYPAQYVPSPEALWWTDQVMPYVKNKQIYSTPGANGIPVYAPPQGYRYPGTTEDNATTAQITAQGYRNTYSLNQILSKADDYNAFGPGALSPDVMTSVSNPAQIVYIGPGLDWFEWSACMYDAAGSQQVDLFWNSSLDATAPGSWGWGYETFNMDGNPADAGYTGGANFAYCDGHAKYAKMAIGGDLVNPDPTAQGGLNAGWYPQAEIIDNAGTGAASCPTNPNNDLTAFEASH